MKVAILGAGAMGCLVGSQLKKGGAGVYLIDPYEQHMKNITDFGLELNIRNHGKEIIHFDGASISSANVGVCDVGIVLVKGLNTKEIIETHKDVFGDDTFVFTFQNGIGNIDTLEEFFPKERIGFGVLKCGANMMEPGKVGGSIMDEGGQFKNLYFSSVIKSEKFAHILEEMKVTFNKAGFLVTISDKTEELIWDKLYLNSIVNIPTAILGLSIQDAVRHPILQELLKEVGREVCEVSTAKGFPMDSDEYWKTYIVPIQNMPKEIKSYSSAAQDAMKKRKTEADFLNGAVIREGKKVGVATPYNEAVWRMGKAMEDFYKIRF